MPPLRLYLVISFIMFLILSLQGISPPGSDLDEEERQEVISALDERLAERIAEGEMTEEEGARVRRQVVGTLEAGTARVIAVDDEGRPMVEEESQQLSDAGDGVQDAVNIDLWEEGEKPEWAEQLEQRLERNLRKVQGDPQALIDDLVDRLPYMMFFMLPLFALVVQMLYLFQGFHYLQHLVFSLHFHSAIFLLGTLTMVLSALTPIEAGSAVWWWMLIYLPLALVRVYGSGYAGAIGKALLLILVAMILSLFAFSGLVLASLVTL